MEGLSNAVSWAGMARGKGPPLTALAGRWPGRFLTNAEWRAEIAGRPGVRTIGLSEQGRPVLGAVIGSGRRHATLIGGAHADEPVGPETLRLLVRAAVWNEPAMAPVLRRWRLWVAPHVNPDGEHANRPWIERWPSAAAFLSSALREPPGRDLEFGFPAMRPENAAVTAFLAGAAPVRLHASLHGMAFAEGAALLIERGWAARTVPLRSAFRREAAACGVGLHDDDRRGEKGFHYLGAGFAATPTGAAMRAHFRAAGDPDTAARFHDSSMEQAARTAPGHAAPLCLVTEVPLFRMAAGGYAAFRARLPALTLRAQQGVPVAGELAQFGVEPVDPRAAIRLQLRAIELGLETAAAARTGGAAFRRTAARSGRRTGRPRRRA